MDPELVKQTQRIAELLTKHIRKTISPEEQAELKQWIGDRADRKNIFTILTCQSPETLAKAIKLYGGLLKDAIILPPKK
jgi:hypothetical protein